MVSSHPKVVPNDCTMQQGLTFEEKKAITKCSTLKVDFFANFHLTHDFLLAEAISTPQKLENAKYQFKGV